MRSAFFLSALLALVPGVSPAQSVLADYHVVDAVPAGLSQPRALTFLPDGRVLVAERTTGRIRVLRNGALLGAPFVDLPVNFAGARGLLGIAAAPDFASSHRLFVLYTRSSTGGDTSAPASISEFRLSRFIASGDTALAGSEIVMRTFPYDVALADHVGGGLRFGPEGALYVGLGTADAVPSPAPALDQLRGKVLRLDATGAAWPDNTFNLDMDPATAPEIFAFGFHDPAYLAAYLYDQPTPPKILASDTGDGANDEVNEVVNGKDYGYPAVQGEYDTAAESAYVATHVRYRPPAWNSGASSVGARGVAAAMADYGFFPVPAFFWGQANGALGVGWDAFTLPEPALTEPFGTGFPAVTDVSFPIRFPMTFLPDFDTLYVLAGNALYLVRKNGTTSVAPAHGVVQLAHAGTHPACGEASVACSLPFGESAKLEVVDVRGRIVATRDITGTAIVRWKAAPGLYFARLGTARLRVVVL